MRLVCVTESWWSKYVDICFHRNYQNPWPTRTMFLVAERDELVAGVCIYDTTGPHVFFEHLVTNETATSRARHTAVTLMAKEMVSYARTVGKIPHILVRHKGVEKILRRAGLVPSGLLSLTCTLDDLEGKHERSDGTEGATGANGNGPEHPGSEPGAAPPGGPAEGDAEDGA